MSPTIRAHRSDRSLHRWQQDTAGFEQLIGRFSAPGDTVCDPFLGSGTTGIAAINSMRRFLGADIDAKQVTAFRKRLKSA